MTVPHPSARQAAPEAPSSQVYEGKAKIVRRLDARTVAIQFKDHATAFDGGKFASIEGKGALNARISALLFQFLGKKGIKTHFLGSIDERTHRAMAVTIVPIEVVVRNVAAGSLVKRLGLEEGMTLEPCLVELYYKKDELHDPLINEEHAQLLGAATPSLIRTIKTQARKINGLLRPLFQELGLVLVDFKLEFGTAGGKLMLADEISPDTCRLWDAVTRTKLDKDRFRFDLGDVLTGYREILRRIESRLGEKGAA